jgi:16S rRNA (uracil1498-N3)-methyltransferase
LLPRLYIDAPLAEGLSLALPPEAVRHAQVLRLQPGAELTLFNGQGGEWSARIDSMGKRAVQAQVLAHHAVERELPIGVSLAVVMPAGERMDFLVEKATELGVAAIQPLMSERSVLRLADERAEKRRAHWQAIAVAACEQCGRNRVPAVEAPLALSAWLASLPARTPNEIRWLLGWREATPWRGAGDSARVRVLSGPEGGLTDAEEAQARAMQFEPVCLGARVLRADTAPLAVAAALALARLPA